MTETGRARAPTGTAGDWVGRGRATRLKVAAPEDVRAASEIYLLKGGNDMTGPYGQETAWFKFAAWFKVRPEIGTVYVTDEGEEARP